MRRVVLITLSGTILLCLFALGGWVYMKTAMHGFSARAEPSHMEAMMAGYARATAMPASARGMKNPIALTPEVEHEALAHFADHCYVCHANNGSGDTMFGKGLYPKPPDMRAAKTQALTDGEMFYIIENGIRMSGMPAFGGADSDDASWKLVYFIRHLPKLTPEEEAQMESLNPKGPDEMKEDKEEEQFLNGGSSAAPTTTMKHMKGNTQ